MRYRHCVCGQDTSQLLSMCESDRGVVILQMCVLAAVSQLLHPSHCVCVMRLSNLYYVEKAIQFHFPFLLLDEFQSIIFTLYSAIFF